MLLYLRFKTRKNKKRNQPGKDEWSVVGYSTAESFDMLGLQEGSEFSIFVQA